MVTLCAVLKVHRSAEATRRLLYVQTGAKAVSRQALLPATPRVFYQYIDLPGMQVHTTTYLHTNLSFQDPRYLPFSCPQALQVWCHSFRKTKACNTHLTWASSLYCERWGQTINYPPGICVCVCLRFSFKKSLLFFNLQNQYIFIILK